ncbi:hypothetical protein FZ445_05570 [Campylobacter jejuni]|nr:hypothetical protein [Campylobacter jejuni]EAK3225717.1 hypothetical protein [Campylobacter jejuni]EAK3495805.1 hypothetical protein [Campylobacter jejuni]ECQ3442100.1 hypothetical protein [Campylobacter jejuni]EDP3690981.1 hypothetical protein [Campylobacter jejuni]
MKKPRNFHYLVNIYFTIKKFKKGLKLRSLSLGKLHDFTIKKFKKGLKLKTKKQSIKINFTIKKFKKGLKTLVD